jgi:hypothetical protein
MLRRFLPVSTKKTSFALFVDFSQTRNSFSSFAGEDENSDWEASMKRQENLNAATQAQMKKLDDRLSKLERDVANLKYKSLKVGVPLVRIKSSTDLIDDLNHFKHCVIAK